MAVETNARGLMDTDTSVVEIPTMEEATSFWLAAVLVQEGQAVQKGQLLARIETQQPASPAGSQTCQELTSPQDGYVVGLHAAAGQIIRAPGILCYICSQPSIAAAKPLPSIASPGTAISDPTALVIFGGGGHGKTIIDLVRATGVYRIVGVFDDGLPQGSDVLGVTVLGGARQLAEWRDRGITMAVNAVGGIGNPAVRQRVFELLAKAGFSFPAIVHPSAVIERSALLEPGVQVCAQAYVGSAARIGFGSLINAGAIVHHDCVLGRVVNLSPGATLAGNVRVGDYAQIGMLATVNLKISVGENALLGNGCTVKGDVPAGGRVWAGTIWPVPGQKAGG